MEERGEEEEEEEEEEEGSGPSTAPIRSLMHSTIELVSFDMAARHILRHTKVISLDAGGLGSLLFVVCGSTGDVPSYNEDDACACKEVKPMGSGTSRRLPLARPSPSLLVPCRVGLFFRIPVTDMLPLVHVVPEDKGGIIWDRECVRALFCPTLMGVDGCDDEVVVVGADDEDVELVVVVVAVVEVVVVDEL